MTLFGRYGSLILLIMLVVIGSSAFSEDDVIIPKEWHGEIFRPKEGALYFKTKLNGFQSPRLVTGNVIVTLYNIILQKQVVLSNAQSDIEGYPREMWRIPSGKYRIVRIEIVDAGGVRRSWIGSGANPTMIVVPRLSLSNLGLWTLSPVGAQGLSVTFAMNRNSYTEERPRKDSSIAVVVNGFNGVIQEVFAGKKAWEGSEIGGTDSNTLRATSSFTRQISVFYRLNLFKDNSVNRDVMQAVSGFDAQLRRCYASALNGNSTLRGTIVFAAVISERTGTMRQIRRASGTLIDSAMTECLANELRQIPLPIRKNMIAELTFTFDVR